MLMKINRLRKTLKQTKFKKIAKFFCLIRELIDNNDDIFDDENSFFNNLFFDF